MHQRWLGKSNRERIDSLPAKRYRVLRCVYILLSFSSLLMGFCSGIPSVPRQSSQAPFPQQVFSPDAWAQSQRTGARGQESTEVQLHTLESQRKLSQYIQRSQTSTPRDSETLQIGIRPGSSNINDRRPSSQRQSTPNIRSDLVDDSSSHYPSRQRSYQRSPRSPLQSYDTNRRQHDNCSPLRRDRSRSPYVYHRSPVESRHRDYHKGGPTHDLNC